MNQTERNARYLVWLDRTEEQVRRCLEQETGGDLDDPAASLRTLTAAVSLLRKIIDIRRILDAWQPDETQTAAFSSIPEEELDAILGKLRSADDESGRVENEMSD